MSRSDKIRRNCLLAFASWHALAMLVGAAPHSELRDGLFAVFSPYLRALKMDNDWGYFAPAPSYGRSTRYEITSTEGRVSEYTIPESEERGATAFGAYRSLFDEIDEAKEKQSAKADLYGDLARFFCRLHANLRPASLTFEVARQSYIAPSEIAAGVDPFDGDHTFVERLEPIPCRDRGVAGETP